jgi:hypothetical protein
LQRAPLAPAKVEASEPCEPKRAEPVTNVEPQITRPEAINPQPPPASGAAPPTLLPARTGPPSTKAPGRKSSARLATPRPKRSRKPRLPLASQARSSHETQCTICAHRYRAEIETEFMHWHTLGHIAYDYKVSRSAIYRHAYALGLFAKRNRLLRFSLGHLVGRVQDVEPTADSIVRAVHAFARINDQGEWLEPPAQVIVSSGGIRREAAAPSGRRPIAIHLDSPALTGQIDEPVAPNRIDWQEGSPHRQAAKHAAKGGRSIDLNTMQLIENIHRRTSKGGTSRCIRLRPQSRFFACRILSAVREESGFFRVMRWLARTFVLRRSGNRNPGGLQRDFASGLPLRSRPLARVYRARSI